MIATSGVWTRFGTNVCPVCERTMRCLGQRVQSWCSYCVKKDSRKAESTVAT